ncbi:MAG: Jag N-terminal domain-containing protein [Clostridia bacterium]|nr:Jag N-terminal domain-containing protein [Clostridia bacterium]
MAIKEYYFEGKSIDAALENAAAQLGEDKDMLTYEVVQTATKGIFGIGATPAKIKIEKEVPDSEVKVPAASAEKAKEKAEPSSVKLPDGFAPEKISKKTKPAPAGERREEKNSTRPMPRRTEPVIAERTLTPVPEDDENVPVITEFLLGLTEKLGIENVRVKISLDENESYFVQIDGSKMGVLIGRRGETLDAAQYITNLAVNRGRDKKIRVVLDSENYRAKRIATLEALANKTADKALKYRRNQALEPMGSYERRIIHATLSGREHITTYSVGTDPRRKVIVAYEK